MFSIGKMKRKANITLWQAATVVRGGDGAVSLSEWVFYAKNRRYWHQKHEYERNGPSVSISDLDLPADPPKKKKILVPYQELTKRQKTIRDKAIKGPIGTFIVGIRPSSYQQKKLTSMLAVSNHAFNWCRKLVTEDKLKATMETLQRIVACGKENKIDPSLRLPDDQWFFENKMTALKLTAVKSFCASFKGSGKKAKLFRDRDGGQFPYTGQFQCPQKYVRPLVPDDMKHVTGHGEEFRQRAICLMPDSFATRRQGRERFLLLKKPLNQLPSLTHDMNIVKLPSCKWQLHIPCSVDFLRRPGSVESNAICGVDPGGRTFMTVYDPTRQAIFECGSSDDKMSIMDKLHRAIDQTQERHKCANKRNKLQAAEDLRRHLLKLHKKLRNKVKGVHVEAASILVNKYALVSLGKIGVSSIVKKKDVKNKDRKIGNKSVRDLVTWSHYKFRKRLQDRANGTPCKIVIQDESYTSKTCGICSVQNHKLEAKEIFKCASCHYVTGRDVNGARNILRKTLQMF